MEKYFGYFPITKPYRELIIFCGGFAFLLILNMIHRPNLSDIPNVDFFGYTGKVISIVIFGYFTGRILLITSSLYFKTLFRLFRLKDVIDDFKKHKETFFKMINREEQTLPPDRNEILRVEIQLLEEKHPLIGDKAERIFYTQEIVRLFLGATLILFLDMAILYRVNATVYFFLVPLVILTLLRLEALNVNYLRNVDLAKFIRRVKK